MGVPRAFRTNNGAEYTNSIFVDYCNGLGIRRELTAPHTPQLNGPVERGLSRMVKVGHAARLEVNKLFPDIHLERLKGSSGSGRLELVDGVCFGGIRAVQPLRDHGEQRHAFPTKSIFRGPPADASLAALQAGVSSCSMAE